MNVRLADDKMLFIFSSRAIFDTIIHKYLDYHVHACLFFLIFNSRCFSFPYQSVIQ